MHVGVSNPKMASKASACCLLNRTLSCSKSISSCGLFGVSEKSKLLCRTSALHVESVPSFSVGQKFQFDDVIEAQQFDRETLSAIFEVARSMENIRNNSSGSQMLKGYLMATLFYEPSTRTRLSFESAMKRLGGDVLTTENAREFSSASKGETLEGACTLLFEKNNVHLWT
jgi:aspartate carbamoyltransferase catalytic subunit